MGDRNHGAAVEFLSDLRDRLENKVQLTTDGHRAYLSAVEEIDFKVDYAMLVKIYGSTTAGAGRYSPPECIGAEIKKIRGRPKRKNINTSFVECQNLTMRMSMRRFTRLTNAFSKKFDNHCHALALYFVWYNWIRIHKTLSVTPAMAAGLTDHLLDMADVVRIIDEYQATQKRAA